MIDGSLDGGRNASAERQSRTLRVLAIRSAAEDVVVLELEDPWGGDLPEWSPGAHLELTLPSGLVRQYSLCGPAEVRSTYEVAVLRVADGRGGSREIHDTGLVGRVLEVRGPRNNFPLIDAESYLLLAGGIGVTPLVPMARELESTGRSWSMVYGGRSLDRMAFTEDLVSLSSERVRVLPEDKEGLPDLRAILGGAEPGCAIYCCGPDAMLTAVERVHEELRDDTTLHIERFAASDEARDRATAPGDAFEVELRRSGQVLQVPPDRTVLDVVSEVVSDVDYACTEGICGTCEAAVIEGEVDHRDEVLTDAEKAAGDTMMICVSRARSSRLVLDL